jgi:membrane protease YdiL (CAAX protease family)
MYVGTMLSAKPWKLERVLLVVACVFACAFAFGLLETIFLRLLGRDKLENGTLSFLLVTTLGTQGSLLISVALTMWWFRIGWREAFGFSTPGKGRAILLGAVAGVVLLFVGGWLQSVSLEVMSHFHLVQNKEPAVESLQKAETLDARVYFIAFSVLIAPVAEEVLFRGILYPGIKQMGFPKIALWGTCLLFAAIHDTPAIFVPLLLMGLVLVWLYETTDNLLAPITAHGVFNGLNIIMFYKQQSLAHLVHF